ncbi:DNA replication and repair protein RecO [Dehalogenimonas formicexedens]|uniref:DNA repair protein RecO n=1 Tax=Dehalogenimonas formicexedens TaxID=1839801 RepID=A0A1P8F6B6_9CHLR|nr:DNA repair protein RecO [Dehalogenimonas formicexedens]APV43988.1 DNA replication and repair protein RecO [Dehalogenimonas formicexedens]
MSAPREVKTEAVVIRRARLREADRVITLFTRELGKISAVAKGVRKAKARLAGHLELLTHTDVTLARGKNLDTVIGSQTLSPNLSIRNSLERTAYALYFAELVSHFAPEEQANRSLFDLFVESLGNLGEAANAELLSRYFELNLLKNLGYRPELRRCPGCGSELKAQTNYFSPSSGGVLCPDCADVSATYPVSVSALKVMRFILENRYDAVARLKLDPELNLEIASLVRAYIHFHLEKGLRSSAWIDELRTQLQA